MKSKDIRIGNLLSNHGTLFTATIHTISRLQEIENKGKKCIDIVPIEVTIKSL